MSADAVRAAIVQALARRAAAQQGQTQALMLRRVEQLRAAHALAASHTSPAVAAAADASAGAPIGAPIGAPTSALAGLSALVDRLGRAPTAAGAVAALGALQAPHGPRPAPPTTPQPLKAVAAYKGTWSRLRAEQRLRLALAQVPAQAGPLNSSHVVHRALKALHGLSPAYLEACMLHIDTLLWLDQASGGGGPTPRTAARAEGRRRGSPIT